MILTHDDNQKIRDYYKECLTSFGPQSAEALSWSSRSAQETRFKILSEVGDLKEKTILDVGCGLGDFYGYLLKKDIIPVYLGIDIVPELIEKAKIKYPRTEFLEKLVDDIPDNSSDFLIASGVLSFKINNFKEKYFSLITKMFSVAKTALAFNMLDKDGPAKGDLLVTWDSEEAIKYCKTLTSKIKLIKGYLEDDFTVYMYH